MPIIASFCQKITDILLPPRCLSCGTDVISAHKFCSPCWSSLRFIIDPCCACCGWPFDFQCDDILLCGQCSYQLPLYTKARSVFGYDDHSRGMIIRFKHNDSTHLAFGFSLLLEQAGKELLEGVDYLVPVPLNRWRLFKRQYNQSALLTQELSKRTHVPALCHTLQRSFSFKTQEGLTRQQRHDNVRGVFHVPLRKRHLLKNKKCLLIDDVWTTGATITACCKALLSAGAREVRVLTVARVLSPSADL